MDAGSARLLEAVGFPALATTSSGLAASLGRTDHSVTRDELVGHVRALTRAVSIPVSVDAERCYPDQPGGVARTVELLADAGASGLSIEDYDTTAGAVVELPEAVAAVAEAVDAARVYGLVLTARAENHLYGIGDLDDTVRRLRAYHEAGADVLYAPGVAAAPDIARLVAETGAPINILVRRGVPPVPELGRLGVRRVSTGGGLAWAAFGALAAAATRLLEDGSYGYLDQVLDPALEDRAFRATG